MAINFWQHQGTVVNTGSTTAEQPSVLYEGNAQILSGTVFKMWFTTGQASSPTGINYAESSNGTTWSLYGSNPVIASKWGARVYKYGATYYLYCSSQVFGTSISSYTSSDGITWTLQQASALAVGGGGAWDSSAVGQLSVIDVINGTWYASYWGINTQTNPTYNTGLATSTDGLTWTKVAGNPVPSLSSGTGWIGSGGQFWQKINGSYYGWSQTTFTSFMRNAANSNNLPTDLMRWNSNSPTGPFVATNTSTFHRSQEAEGISTAHGSTNTITNLQYGQVADPCLISDGTNLWMFFTQSLNGSLGTTYTIGAAKIPNMTFAQLVQTYEGISGIPISGNPLLNCQVIGSDNFAGSDANPIGGNWTTLTGSGSLSPIVAAQRKSNLFESSATSGQCDSYWNVGSFNSDQFSQITLWACDNTGSYICPAIRYTTGNCVRPYWNAPSTGLGHAGTLAVEQCASGSFDLSNNLTITFSQGDTLLLVAIGTMAYLYWNGELIAAHPVTVVGGAPGAFVLPGTAVSHAAISAWSGGNANITPAYSSGVSSSSSWVTISLQNSLRGLKH